MECDISSSTKFLGLATVLSIIAFGVGIYLSIHEPRGRGDDGGGEAGRAGPASAGTGRESEEEVSAKEELRTTTKKEEEIPLDRPSTSYVPEEKPRRSKAISITEKEQQEVPDKKLRKKVFLSEKELHENLSIVRNHIKSSSYMSDKELLALVSNANRNVIIVGVKQGNYKLTLALLKLGASYDVADRKGLYPVHVAAEKGYVEILQLLEDWGANIRKKDLTGYTILHRATLRGNTSMVQWILSKPIDINQSNRAGWTAMHLAACGGHVDIAKLLVQAGANVNPKDVDGWTPLYLAVLFKKHTMEDYLKSVGGV